MNKITRTSTASRFSLIANNSIVQRAYHSLVPLKWRKIIRGKTTASKLSIVVPCYNVSRYLDDFFESILKQGKYLKGVEIICVNDGSKDDTLERLEQWQKRLPEHVKIITQQNSGLSAARNTGMNAAVGQWVSFPDPDDFLHDNYLKIIKRELVNVHKTPLLSVSARLVYFWENTGEFTTTHPLDWKFKRKPVYKKSDDLGNYIQLAANTTWLSLDAIRKHDLQFEGHGWASFEDAHLINKLYSKEPGKTLAFVKNAVYYYRKRADQSSMVDTATKKKSFWLDQMEHGCLDLIVDSSQNGMSPPKFIQRTVLYETFYHIRDIIKHPDLIKTVLNDDEIIKFYDILTKIFEGIDESTIIEFELAGITEEHRVGILGLFKNVRKLPTPVYFKSIGSNKKTVRFSWYSSGSFDLTPTVIVNHEKRDYSVVGGRAVKLLGRLYYRDTCFEVDVDDDDEIQVLLDGVPAIIKDRGKKISEIVSLNDLKAARIYPTPSENLLSLNPEQAMLREFALSERAKDKYTGCWVFIDADTRADDNAEHLYRYIMNTNKFQSSYFILREESPDWARLEAEGFQLLPFGSPEHIAAQFNSDLLISSHADHYVLWPADSRIFRDLKKYKFVFLQHGVIHNDLSGWLNSKDIQLITTSSIDEYRDIVDRNGHYALTEKEVKLTGLARHDSLIKKSKESIQNSILIAPTWRRSLTDETNRFGNARGQVAAFWESDFLKKWREILDSEYLQAVAREAGLKIIFAPHPNLTMYLPDLILPDWIDVVDVSKGQVYQDIISRAKVVITDYSSIAFEAAVIQRPVIYYQFDSDKFFSGEHVFPRGYFDHKINGFGPVYAESGDVLTEVSRIVQNGAQHEFMRRSEDVFPCIDGKSCDRIFEELLQLSH